MIAERGALIYKQHPNYPYVIVEIETSKGCDRSSFCSYCTEFLKGKITYRSIEGIVSEIKSLYDNGCRYFRIGKQSNILSYMGPEPNPEAIRYLYQKIHSVAPNLKVLHTDNANALFIENYPKKSQQILEILSNNVTPGDVLPFGIETFDSHVVKMNNLKTFADDSIKALKLVAEIGGYREDLSAQDGFDLWMPDDQRGNFVTFVAFFPIPGLILY
jgi:radical SAM superfamily enzyme with C-terminal helix-hairpin-helix motif